MNKYYTQYHVFKNECSSIWEHLNLYKFGYHDSGTILIKESLKVNVVYFIKLVILWHLKKFVVKYELSLLSYFIIAVLVCFII